MATSCAAEQPPDDRRGVPATIPTDWTVAESDLPALLDKRKQEVAEQYKLRSHEIPQGVTVVRIVKPEEWSFAQIKFLKEFGFGASRSQGGIVFDDVPDSQQLARRQASYTCEVRFPIDPRRHLKLPSNQANKQFDHLVDVVKPCVESRFNVTIATPPSREVWLSAYYNNGDIWDPFKAVSSDADLLDRAYKECPHDAPGIYPS